MKKIVSLLMACVLCLSVLTAAAEETKEEATDEPVIEKEVDFYIAGFEDSQYRDWQQNAFFTYMEEATGMHLGLKQYNDPAQWKKVKASYQKGGEMPDALFKAALTDSECMEMLDAGVLIDLKPYLEENCPNLFKILTEKPQVLKEITLPDGRIAALPFINETPLQNCMWINKDFLNAVKKKVPTTMEELTEVLKAFKEYDVNQNGNAGDEIPLGFLGAFDLKFLAHGFGLICNDYNIFVEDGQVKFMPLEENFRPFVQWCRENYEKGILDHNGFSTSDAIRRETKDDATPVYGVIITSSVSNVMPPAWNDKYEMLMPLSFEGKQIYRDFAGGISTGTFAVTSQCKDVEKVLKWVDYLYSEEGAVLAAVGKERVDYVVDGDKTWRLTERASGDAYHTLNTLMASATPIPGISADKFQSAFHDGSIRAMVEKVQKFNSFCAAPFPSYTLTQEQKDFVSPLQNEIGKYVDLQIGRWILGEIEITDESFETFENTLNEMGLKEFINFWQNIYNTQN